MEALLKKCYKEAGIFGANALTYENRSKTISRILDEEEMEEGFYEHIALWLMGENSDEIEESLVNLEKNFCMEDREFSIENEKEMQVLAAVLLLKYCRSCEEVVNALRILCGNSGGKKLLCETLYDEFSDVVENCRLEERKYRITENKIKPTKLEELKSLITKIREEIEEEERQYTTQQLDMLLKIVEIQEQNIRQLERSREDLQDQISCQREESNVLWWVINEWSETYKKIFSDMTVEEMAIAIPIELNENSEYNLLPYAAERIITTLFQRYGKKMEKKPLTDYLKHITEALVEVWNTDWNISWDSIEKVQPILGAFCCMKECGMEEAAWKGMMSKKYKCNVDEIVMSPEEFAVHFCLELELLNYLS